jgi:hypothetical protein
MLRDVVHSGSAAQLLGLAISPLPILELVLEFLSILGVQIIAIGSDSLAAALVLMFVSSASFVQILAKPRPAAASAPRALAVIALASSAIHLRAVASPTVIRHRYSPNSDSVTARACL